MNRRTWTIVGATIVACGIGLVALGQVQADADVRFVEDVLASPDGHDRGTYTLLGRPQPAEVPVTGAEGTRMQANAAYNGTVRYVVAWDEDGALMHATHSVTATNLDGSVTWRHVNETRRAGAPDVLAREEATWQTPGYAFAVEAFDDGDGVSPRIWAVYDGVLPQPLQPKPSQFTGRLATLPDMPPGALVWEVETVVAQCSSKFLPPEELDGAKTDQE